MGQIVRFVDRPGGTTLLDLSPSTTGLVLGPDGVSAPPPPIVRTVTQSPTDDGGTVGSQTYGFRSVKVHVAYTTGIRATTAAEAAQRRTDVQTLMRVMARNRVWLEVWPDGAAEARYLYCYRSTDENLLASLEGLGSRWAELTLDLMADPFAVGPVTSLGGQTTTLAGDFKFTVSGASVKGDVPAPLVLFWSAAGGASAKVMFIASKVGGAKHKMVVETSGLARGAIPPAGSAFADGIASATALNATADQWSAVVAGQKYVVATGNVISNAGGTPDAIQGSYRVLMFCPVLTAGDVWKHQLFLRVPSFYSGFSPDGVALNQEQVATGIGQYVDFGIVDVPYGGRSLQAGFAADFPVLPVTIDVLTTLVSSAGASGLKQFDALLVLPADDSFLTIQWGEVAGSRTLYFDPYTGQMIVTQGGATVVGDAVSVSAVGEAPMVVPGVDVDVFAFMCTGGQGIPLTGTPTGVTFVSPYYWPRYLTVV